MPARLITDRFAKRPNNAMLRIGAWYVNPASSQISRAGESAHVEARALRLLVCLAQHAGEVVSIDHLLDQVWAGVIVTPDSVYQAVASLRRLLGDDPKHPIYIETVPRLGYRLVAEVSQDGATEASTTTEDPLPVPSAASVDDGPAPRQLLPSFGWSSAIGLVLGFVLVGALALLFHGKALRKTLTAPSSNTLSQQPKSIAVLPFVDLSEGMKEEEFADGMTEELIDHFSKIPGLRVPAPTAAFYFKNKQPPLSDIAKALGVGYVLDGSVRKSGARMRVAARLFCADSGYVIWSESYDRPLRDALTLQDEIADEVTRALKASISPELQPAKLP